MTTHILSVSPVATVHSLDAARERRHYIDLANSSGTFQSIKESFAISGTVLGEDDAEIMGRIIAGEITLEQAILSIHHRLNLG